MPGQRSGVHYLSISSNHMMDCQTTEITDDESSLGTPEKTYKEPKEGTRPVTLDVEKMREGIIHTRVHWADDRKTDKTTYSS
jgi:hypothetical protein